MKIFPNSRCLLLLTICFFINAIPSWGRHIVGGEIFYTFLTENPDGTKQFRFTMNLYRDCNSGGAAFDNPAEIAIYRGSWSQAILVESFQVSVFEIKALTTTSNCSPTQPDICLEKGSYIFERSLPAVPVESYFIVYQRCCLAQTLSNIVNPGDMGMTIMVELSAISMALNNSSPEFVDYPTVALCNHVPMSVEQSATDAEGDMLFYSFAAPLSGGGPILSPPGLYSCSGAVPTPPCGPPYENLLYVMPDYSPAAPLAGDPVILIDTQNGLIDGTPRQIGQFMAGIVCLEYRGATQLSAVRRNVIFNVFDDPVDTDETESAQGRFRVRPNPAINWVSWPGELDIQEIRLFDMLGRCLKTIRGDNLDEMDIQDVLPGHYRLVATDENGSVLSGALLVIP